MARRALLVPIVLVCGSFVAVGRAGDASKDTAPPWKARGDVVEANGAAYKQRLKRTYDALCAQIAVDAPDLLVSLKQDPPRPVASGYGTLPKLIPDDLPPTTPPPPKVSAYSWPWTDTMISREGKKLDAIDADLARLPKLPAPERRPVYEKLVTAYLPLPAGQRLIDTHIQYNRLWQKEIAADRPTYDRWTRLQKGVLTHTMADEIHEVTGRIAPPPFLRIEHPDPRRWIFRVPIYTDIDDADFLRAFQSAVERTWRLTDGDDDYAVVLSMKRLDARRLYRHAGEGTPAPRRGDAIDPPAHCAMFPKDAAVLTTGAVTTHVSGTRCVVIGPHDITAHVLAHEFGHVLGFRDIYFRGYQDLGPDGFEVDEVIAEPNDIMGAPGVGPVRKRHFEDLLAAIR